MFALQWDGSGLKFCAFVPSYSSPLVPLRLTGDVRVEPNRPVLKTRELDQSRHSRGVDPLSVRRCAAHFSLSGDSPDPVSCERLTRKRTIAELKEKGAHPWRSGTHRPVIHSSISRPNS